MSIRALRTFIAITRSGSFAAAAREVGLTQAAVSLQIKMLESELNTKLFDRIGRSAILNTSGRNLIPTATAILGLYEDMALSVSTEDLGGSLQIGAIPTVFARLLPEALLQLRRDHPRMEIRVISGISADLIGKVERGELDAALIADPASPLPKALAQHQITQETLAFVACKTPTKTHPRKLLSGEPFIRLSRLSGTGKLIDQMLRERGVRIQEFMELDTPELITEMVARGLGVSIIPMYGGNWLRDPRLRLWRIDRPRIVRAVSLIERQAHPRTRLTGALLQRLLDISSATEKLVITSTLTL